MRINCSKLQDIGIAMQWKDQNGKMPITLSNGNLDISFTGSLHEEVEQAFEDLRDAITRHTNVRGFESTQMMRRMQDEVMLASMLNALKKLAREGE